MDLNLLRNYIDHGREIEFEYDGKKYSITYGMFNAREVISFCEFYKETTEVDNMEDLLQISRNGVSVREMWESLNENEVWIF